MTATTKKLPALDLLVCAPRGFCAGVIRAIDTVEQALARYGAPVYVRHEIVHNRFVVEELEKKGAIFISDLEQIKDSSRPVIFSAHGSPKSAFEVAKKRGIEVIDATCPLVVKVHREVISHNKRKRHVLLIGHRGHVEVIGTTGQIERGAISLIETCADAESFEPPRDCELAYATQTTLSVDDTAQIIEVLKRRFPDIKEPAKDDICYATSNRQAAVKRVAIDVDVMLIVGSDNSSNSRRLTEVARKSGCERSYLIGSVRDIVWDEFNDIKALGLSAGASAPERLVREIIAEFYRRFDVTEREVVLLNEKVYFSLPKILRQKVERQGDTRDAAVAGV